MELGLAGVRLMARHRIHSLSFKKQIVQEYAAGRPSAAWPPGPLHATLWWAGLGAHFFQFHLRSAGQGGRDKLQPRLRGPLLTRLKALRQAKEGDQDRRVRLTSGDAGVSRSPRRSGDREESRSHAARRRQWPALLLLLSRAAYAGDSSGVGCAALAPLADGLGGHAIAGAAHPWARSNGRSQRGPPGSCGPLGHQDLLGRAGLASRSPVRLRSVRGIKHGVRPLGEPVGNFDPLGRSRYSPDSMARSRRKRISRLLLVSEITNRIRPWLAVSA